MWILILGAQNSVLVTWTSVPIIQSSVTGIQTSVIIHRIQSAYLDFVPHDIEPRSVYTEFSGVRVVGLCRIQFWVSMVAMSIRPHKRLAMILLCSTAIYSTGHYFLALHRGRFAPTAVAVVPATSSMPALGYLSLVPPHSSLSVRGTRIMHFRMDAVMIPIANGI